MTHCIPRYHTFYRTSDSRFRLFTFWQITPSLSRRFAVLLWLRLEMKINTALWAFPSQTLHLTGEKYAWPSAAPQPGCTSSLSLRLHAYRLPQQKITRRQSFSHFTHNCLRIFPSPSGSIYSNGFTVADRMLKWFKRRSFEMIKFLCLSLVYLKKTCEFYLFIFFKFRTLKVFLVSKP